MASFAEVIYTGLKNGRDLALTEKIHSDKTEHDLILEATRGSKEAFGEIVNLYMKKAYYAAYSYLHNEQDALDVSQDAFIRAYKNIHRFDTSKPFFPWLYRIVRNLSFDLLKKNKKHRSVPIDTVFNVASEQHEMFANEALWDAIHSLPDEQKEIIMLRFFQGYSYQEIADMLGKPIGSIMSALHYIKKKLGVFLSQERVK